MTSEQMGKAFIQCEDHWIWLPGMLAQTEEGQSWRLDECDDRGGQPRATTPTEWYPDVTDPITAWGTLELVKRAGALITKLSVLPTGCSMVVEWPHTFSRYSGISSYGGNTLAEVTLMALSDAQDRERKYNDARH
tara:strand:- start:10510 stop:10914 length:405 start_codon:yes stop_codon:yes gene_type:complete